MRIMSTVPVRLGLMVRPQVSHYRPFLSGTPQQDAGTTLMLSAKGLAGVEGWLTGLRPANWTELASMVSSRAATQVADLDQNVIGKLGSDEGEQTAKALRSKWQALKDRADQALANAPGVVATTWDKIVQFFSDAVPAYASPSAAVADLVQYAKGLWQDFSAKAVEYSGDVLEEYHTDVNLVLSLQADLENAKASGQYTQGEIMDQAAKISAAQTMIDGIRSKFAAMSGGVSLDEIAQQKYGKFGMSGPQLIAGLAIAAVGLAILAYIVHMLTATVKEINPFTTKDGNPDSKLAGQVAVGAVVVIALAFLLKD